MVNGRQSAADKQLPADKTQPQVLRFNLGDEPPTLDPALAEDNLAAAVIGQLFEGLTRLSLAGVEPGLAEKWEISPDGTVYTFHLRRAKWSNGDPVKAGDFEFSWKRVLDPDTGSPYAYQLYYIKGAEEFNAADPARVGENRLRALRDAVGVKAIDDTTLEVTLNNPTPYFLELTAFFTYMPVNPGVVEANPRRWANEVDSLVVNGPFRLAQWRHQRDLTLVRNDTYWDAASVKLNRVEMLMAGDPSASLTMFQNGELDMTMPGLVPLADTPALLQKGEARVAPYLATYYLSFNTTRKPLRDPRVRRALSLAVDRAAITEHVLKGGQIPALAFVPPGLENRTTGKDFREEGGDLLADADVETARRLLEEAGYPGGAGFPKLTLLYNTEGFHKSVMEAIQQMWKEALGIQVELRGLEWQALGEARAKRDFDIARNGWSGDYADPMTFLDLLTSGSQLNDQGWRNAAYDGLIAQAKAAKSPTERLSLLHDAERVLMEEMPVAPVYFYVQIWQQKGYVKGAYLDIQGSVFLRSASVEPH